MVRARFAPSPTGDLHAGGMRTALLNFLYAVKYAGEFFLRMDDTDRERSKDEYVENIKKDLAWMDLQWKELVFQSERLDLYRKALGKLVENGRAYACYETRDELDFKRRMQLRRGKPPVYDRAGLKLTQQEKNELEKQGKRPHWRFFLERDVVRWVELNGQNISFQMSSISDPVLMRQDGIPLYSISSVVDDGEMGITHIIRGDDHITNTAVQIELFQALGFKPPKTLHLGLVTNEKGSPLSKRSKDYLSIADLKNNMESMALNIALAELGNSSPPDPCANLEELASQMNFSALGSSSICFSLKKLQRFNKWVIRNRNFADARLKLGDISISAEKAEEFWSVISPNVDSWNHAAHWYRIMFADEEVDFNLKLCPVTLEVIRLVEQQIDANNWKKFLENNSKFTKAELNAGVRWALTGEKHSPATLDIINFMNSNIMRKRIKTAYHLLENKDQSL